MYTVARVSIQIRTVEEQENAVRELKSSETAVPREGLSHQQYIASCERGEAPIPSMCRIYPGAARKAVTQLGRTESKSHPSSVPAPGAC